MIYAEVNPQSITAEKGTKKRSEGQTLLQALAKAIDDTDENETLRLAKEFTQSFGHENRVLVGAESTRQNGADGTSGRMGRQTQQRMDRTLESLEPAPLAEVAEVVGERKKRNDSPPSSDSSDSDKPKKKKKKRSSRKKKARKDSEESLSSSDSSDTSSSEGDSTTGSSDVEDAELCYEVTDFESADLPDLPEKWDKNFSKLRSYVPLSLFKSALLDSYYDDELDQKTKDKSELSKTSLKLAERQLTYGDFIEMCDLEERYAREIYGLETYADYIVKHKKIISDLKKSYNCWMIALRYHLKVRTVIFRRRKLIKSKVKGKTALKDKVKIPNGLQPSVEQQARHEADRAGDLQHVDNPYAPGGPKYGFNFATGRQQVGNKSSAIVEKTLESRVLPSQAVQRGKRAGASGRPFMRRQNPNYFRGGRYSYQEHNYDARSYPQQQHHGQVQYQNQNQAIQYQNQNPAVQYSQNITPQQGKPYYPHKAQRQIAGPGPNKSQATEGQTS